MMDYFMIVKNTTKIYSALQAASKGNKQFIYYLNNSKYHNYLKLHMKLNESVLIIDKDEKRVLYQASIECINGDNVQLELRPTVNVYYESEFDYLKSFVELKLIFDKFFEVSNYLFKISQYNYSEYRTIVNELNKMNNNHVQEYKKATIAKFTLFPSAVECYVDFINNPNSDLLTSISARLNGISGKLLKNINQYDSFESEGTRYIDDLIMSINKEKSQNTPLGKILNIKEIYDYALKFYEVQFYKKLCQK